MKHILLSILLAMPLAALAQSSAPAFPGAEGFARYAVSGGRGGTVYHVTNLNDSGAGSLREAIGKSGKRTIVFDVGGTICLKSNLQIKNGDLSILGQTAPGGGITLRDYTLEQRANNVVIRFIRVRRGNAVDVNDGADAFWGRNRSNIIIDHCSMSWSIDEVASFYDNNNFTMQWCTICEGLNNAGHDKGAHGYGGIWGGKGASFHHNLLAHNNNRNPRLNGARYNWDGYDHDLFANSMEAERVDLRNCVMFNWGDGNGAYGGPGGGRHNIVNCYYKAGPSTKNKTRVFQCSKNNSSDSKGAIPNNVYGKFYINGNYVTAGSPSANYDWRGVIADGGQSVLDTIKLTSPVDFGEVTTHTAEKAYEKVLAWAGASLARDAVDARYAEEARTGTVQYKGSVTKKLGIIDTQEDVGGWPELEAGTPRTDTDGDGIPDDWETANGLNPNSAADGKTFTLDPKGFYTNLEVYANSLVQQIMISGNSESIDGVAEYYPAYTLPDGTQVEAVNTINTPKAGTPADNAAYDLGGRQVKAGAKGLVVEKGKKVIR